MRIEKDSIPVVIDVPGAKARQIKDFGDVSDYSKLAGEYFSLAKGTDFAGLLAGLKDDMCHSPHWGYVVEGRLTVEFLDGKIETPSAGDLFYWPPGHTIKADEDTNMVLFSPEKEHCEVIEHVKSKLG